MQRVRCVQMPMEKAVARAGCRREGTRARNESNAASRREVLVGSRRRRFSCRLAKIFCFEIWAFGFGGDDKREVSVALELDMRRTEAPVGGAMIGLAMLVSFKWAGCTWPLWMDGVVLRLSEIRTLLSDVARPYWWQLRLILPRPCWLN